MYSEHSIEYSSGICSIQSIHIPEIKTKSDINAKMKDVLIYATSFTTRWRNIKHESLMRYFNDKNNIHNHKCQFILEYFEPDRVSKDQHTRGKEKFLLKTLIQTRN